MRFSGSVCFEIKLSNEYLSFVPIDEDKAGGGVVICNEDRTSEKEEAGNDDEESDNME